MSKVRFAVVGSGWRSLFYIRIAKALPEIFELTALLCRSREKADRFRREYGICAVTDDRELMDSDPDFIVSAVSENSIAETAAKWASLGFPVLSETPAGLSVEQLEMLWDLYENSGCRIQIAEQYQFYPRYDAMIRLVQSGILGEPVSLDISAMHGCHAASIIRCLLGTGLEETGITGRTFFLPVTETRTRYEVLTTGTISKKDRPTQSLNSKTAERLSMIFFPSSTGVPYAAARSVCAGHGAISSTTRFLTWTEITFRGRRPF